MKKFLAGCIIFFSLSIAAAAQDGDVAKWASDKGFWIIESNLHDKSNCTVYFYNNEKQLVYKEKIEGKVLNAKKKKVKMKLKNVLEQTVAQFDKLQKVTENEKLVAVLL